MMGTAGIAAEKYSHVKYFPNRPAYYYYYDIAVDISKFGVESFDMLGQEVLVECLRAKYGDKVADWCRDFWMGERGRMCLAHTRYARCNNNMGVEVSWRLIKEAISGLASFSEFIRALCKFICRQLGDEHRNRMRTAGDANAFICHPKATKERYTAVQVVCVSQDPKRVLYIGGIHQQGPSRRPIQQHGEDDYGELDCTVAVAYKDRSVNFFAPSPPFRG